MRIWSLDPKYLDQKGLLACWRETLLAKHVLENKTKWYKNHPQLIRFKNSADPKNAINYYLFLIASEAKSRNYNFDFSKIWDFEVCKIAVTSGQLEYEKQHLLKKLLVRDISRYEKLKDEKLQPAKIFFLVEWEIESWEKL